MVVDAVEVEDAFEGSVKDLLVMIDWASRISFIDTLAYKLSTSTDNEELCNTEFTVLLLRFNSIPIGSTIGCGFQASMLRSTKTSWLCTDTWRDSRNSLFCRRVIVLIPAE